MKNAKWNAALLVVAAIAGAVRLAYLIELKGTAFFSVLIGDSLMFDALARRIIAGEWSGSELFYQAQFYPYFLATSYKLFGGDAFAVRVVQAGLGTASCVLLAIAGRRFFNPRAGLLAGGLLAVYPPAIFFDGLINKSGPDLLLMVVLLLAVATCIERPRAAWLLLAGVAVGALSWNRENARVLFPLVAAWLLIWHRLTPLWQRARMVAFFAAGTALVLAPVAIRNARTSGELFVTTSQFGPNFYIGNHAGASGGYEPLVAGRGNALYEREDAVRIAEAAAGRPLSPNEVSDYWRDRALRDIRAAPGAWLRLLAKKSWLTVSAAEPLDTESLAAYSSFSRVLRVLRPFTFGVVLALAIFGAWITRRDWRRLSVLYAMFAVLAASVAAFFVFARYRYPLVPVAMLFAGAGAASLWELRRSTLREWLPGAIAALAAVVLLHIPVATSADVTFVNYGAELLRQGRAEEAVPLLREGIRRDPENPRAYLDLALALQQTDQDPLPAFDAAVRLTPNAAEAHAGRAMTLHQQGRVDEAIAAYAEAVRLKPESVEILSNYAVALVDAGRTEQAATIFDRAAALQPENMALQLNRCNSIAKTNAGDAAIRCYRQVAALARTPQHILESQYALAEALSAAARFSEALASLHRARAAAQTLGDTAAMAGIDNALRVVEAASRR